MKRKSNSLETLLDQAFGIKGYRHIETVCDAGKITFVLEPDGFPKQVRESPDDFVKHGVRWRTVRSLSIGLQPVYLKVKVQRWRNEQTGAEFEHSPPLPGRTAGWLAILSGASLR